MLLKDYIEKNKGLLEKNEVELMKKTGYDDSGSIGFVSGLLRIKAESLSTDQLSKDFLMDDEDTSKDLKQQTQSRDHFVSPLVHICDFEDEVTITKANDGLVEIIVNVLAPEYSLFEILHGKHPDFDGAKQWTLFEYLKTHNAKASLEFSIEHPVEDIGQIGRLTIYFDNEKLDICGELNLTSLTEDEIALYLIPSFHEFKKLDKDMLNIRIKS